MQRSFHLQCVALQSSESVTECMVILGLGLFYLKARIVIGGAKVSWLLRGMVAKGLATS